MRRPARISFLLFIFFVLIQGVGCVSHQADPGVALPARIGEPRDRDTTGMEAFEVIAVKLMDHMADAAKVLSSVEDTASSQYAAGMADEAIERFVTLRQDLEEADKTRKISSAELIFKYGTRYLWSKHALEQQISRIKRLDPAAGGPVLEAISRLKAGLEEKDLPSDP